MADGLIVGRVLRFTAPPAPELDVIPALTNQAAILVSGTTEPGARVDARVGADEHLVSTQADAGGEFALTLSLAPNARTLIQVFATAHGGTGLTSAPAGMAITHDGMPPDTIITSGPASPTSETTVTFGLTGTDNVTPPGSLRFAWRLDSQPFGGFSSAASVTLTGLTDGAHTFEVVAQDEAGNVDPTPTATTFTVSRFQVTLDEPAAGVTVGAGLLLVRGRIATGGREVGVTVNGVAAAVHGDTFVALVPVTAATTRVSIVVTAADGATMTQALPVTVAAAADSPFLLVATPPAGVAPLTATFTLLGVPDGAMIESDFDGNGSVDFIGPDLDGQAFTYTQPGLYLPRVSVTDSQGNRATVPAVVQVFDPAALDALLQAKWAALKDALRMGDIPNALTQIASRSRSRYQQDFTVLTPDLPSIDTILTDLTFLEVLGEDAIFVMRRIDGSTAKSFEVRFQVDADGLWRLRVF